jgi:hypothetical protein
LGTAADRYGQAVDDGDGEGTHNAVISHSASGGDYEGIAIDSVIVMIEEHVQQINLIVNGNFELPRVQPLPPYWRGWPDNWTLASGTVIIDNEPTKWTVSPYNEPLGNQYLIGLPSGEFYQDVTASFLADKTYRLVVDLGTLGADPMWNFYPITGCPNKYSMGARRSKQLRLSYCRQVGCKTELTYTAPSADGPVGKPIRVYNGFKNAPSGTYRNGICADNVDCLFMILILLRLRYSYRIRDGLQVLTNSAKQPIHIVLYLALTDRRRYNCFKL